MKDLHPLEDLFGAPAPELTRVDSIAVAAGDTIPAFARPWTVATLATIALIGLVVPGSTQPASHKGQGHRGQPVRGAPEITGSIPARTSTKPPKPTAESDESLPEPYNLPIASRQRVRECGDKWQAIKQSGSSGDMIWRDFASGCLAAKNGSDTHQP